MADKDYISGSLNPLNIPRAIQHDLLFYRQNPDYFAPDGIWVFCGKQGSGKTLSAVRCLKNLLADYPKAMVCSNLQINGLDREIIPFTAYEQIGSMSNAEKGIIFLIDEIHVLWNSLESKNIPISEMLNFCQMRKDRRLILGTSQVYGRIAKPIREQLKYVILCRNILKYIQYNTVVDPVPDGFTTDDNDGDLSGEIIKHSLFFHSPEDYKAYDTLYKIQRFERSKKHV